jgi:hypothetical protein
MRYHQRMMRQRDSKWLDLTQAVAEYPFSRRTFWLWISRGELAAYKPFKRKTLVRRADIEQLIAAKRLNPGSAGGSSSAVSGKGSVEP